MKTREIIENLYYEKKDFIIVGLTGRTGSGCSEAANLLSKDFVELNPVVPKSRDFNSKKERQYNILYKYAKKNWRKFYKIEVSDIITSFILEKNFSEFVGWMSDIDKNEFIIKDKNMTEKDRIKEHKIICGEMKQFIAQIIELDLDCDFDYLSSRIKNMLDTNNPERSIKVYEDVCKFSSSLKEKMKNINKSCYTHVYQLAANNIRSSGDYCNSEENASKVSTIIERINHIIKMIRESEKNNTLIVIDAIRNPYEAVFLKDRYSAFYLFSINVEDETRKYRLVKSDFNKRQIENLDNIEYPKKDEGFKAFISQDIQSCLELSDVHLNNPDDYKREELKKGLLKYISLIMHPGLVSPTEQERCMQIAYTAKLNSGCLSRQVGAVLTDKNYYLRAMGWNDAPEGQVECNLRCLENLFNRSDNVAYSKYEYDEEFQKSINKYLTKIDLDVNNHSEMSGRAYHYCFKDIKNYHDGEKNQVHTRSLHAEENAILLLAKFGGKDIEGGNLFVTASPCELCSKKIYHLGIKKIYYIDPYPGISTNHILDSGYKKIELKLFEGAIGKAYHQFFTPVMPIKDELGMMTGMNFKK